MSSKSGRDLSGVDHLRQSVVDILTTPIGSRVMRRDYGSRLFQLIDRPFNPALKLELIAATATALMVWEPRLEISSVAIVAFDAGRVSIEIEGLYLPDGETITLDGIEVS